MTVDSAPRLSTLSVVMIVKNEEDQLDGCLRSIADLADEIVIVDSGSEDQTEAIARRYGARFYVRQDWAGFGRQRQRAEALAVGDYILALDADERVRPRLKESIRQLLEKPVLRQRPFALKRRDLLDGQALYPLGYREKLVRLYSRLDFQYNDLPVHESVDYDRKKAIALKGDLDHYFCDDLENYRQKRQRYSRDWALAAYQNGKRAGSAAPLGRALACFLKHYLLRGGALSGQLGLLFCWQVAAYTWNKYRLLKQLQRSGGQWHSGQ